MSELSQEIKQLPTEQNNELKPIYQKVQQLLQIKHQHAVTQKQIKFVQIIQPVPKVDLKINIDRSQDFIHRKQNCINLLNNHNQFNNNNNNNNNLMMKKTTGQFAKSITKSEKMLHFLKTRKSSPVLRKDELPQIDIKQQEIDRETFTPMRPISRRSRIPESVTGTQFTKKSGSQNKSSGGYSQVVRLSQSSKKSSTPSKYLRKGHRMREVLLRQIETPEDIQEEKQLVYLKQYDQWVPASLATYKKLELEHFMNILTGGKKTEKKQMINFEPYYL